MSETREAVQVIVAYDFTPSAEQALMRAVELAAQAPHHVLHVIDVLDPMRDTYETAERIQEMLVERLASAFNDRANASEVHFYVHARIGRAATEILRLAQEVGADMVLIGSHGGRHRLLGSTSERVTREARCPVTVAREKTYEHVDLHPVARYDHERHPHKQPHRYSYSSNVITRPSDWPIG